MYGPPLSGFLVFRMGLVGGGLTFTGSRPWSLHVSGVTTVGLLGLLVLVGWLVLEVEVDPFNCKFEISSTLLSELIEGRRALSEMWQGWDAERSSKSWDYLTISFLREGVRVSVSVSIVS